MSENSLIEKFLIFPKRIRFKSQRLYPPPKTIPLAQKIAAQLFNTKQPNIIKNSPIKLDVPGNPILAIVNKVKNTE